MITFTVMIFSGILYQQSGVVDGNFNFEQDQIKFRKMISKIYEYNKINEDLWLFTPKNMTRSHLWFMVDFMYIIFARIFSRILNLRYWTKYKILRLLVTWPSCFAFSGRKGFLHVSNCIQREFAISTQRNSILVHML